MEEAKWVLLFAFCALWPALTIALTIAAVRMVERVFEPGPRCPQCRAVTEKEAA